MNKGIKLILKENTTLDVYFSDGKVKRYDVLKLSDKFPQLLELKNRELFLKGKLLGTSCVRWNENLDIDIDTIYNEGIDVESKYDDITNVILGFKIKEKRINLDLSQEELANLAGIDQSDLSKIEKGSSNPSLKTIGKIVKSLNSRISIK